MTILANIFVQVVHITFLASIVIGVVLVLRVLLKKAPKIFSYVLWAIVLLRLLCPVTISSVFSIFGWVDVPTSRQERITYIPTTDEIVSGIPDSDIEWSVSTEVEDVIDKKISSGKDVWQVSVAILSVVWLMGAFTLTGYGIVQLFGLKRCLKGAVPFEGNIYLADYISSPFVLGIVAPKIYLPSNLDEAEYEYIILHEKTHIRRGDHIVKILAYLALCIHWFNPLVWVSFMLAGRDMEMSCDEAVIKKQGVDIRAKYSESLLRFATGQKLTVGMPLAFGEGETKGRVKNVMTYQKPQLWISFIAVGVCVVAGVCLLTNPKENVDGKIVEEMGESGTPGQEENTETEYVVSEPEEVISEHIILTKPPQMLLQDALSSKLDFFPVVAGTYSWNYTENRNEMTSVEASGAFPTVAVKGQEWIRLTDYNGIDYTPYAMRFEITPDQVTVREYDSLELGDENATCLSEKVLDNVYLLELQPRRIYEVIVEWDKAKMETNGFFGTAYYAFATWDSTMNLEPEEEETQISIVAHVKEVMADRKNSIVISSDTTEFPGAFILEIPEEVYDIKTLEGGESISVIMKKSEDKPLNTLEVYDAVYITRNEKEGQQ